MVLAVKSSLKLNRQKHELQLGGFQTPFAMFLPAAWVILQLPDGCSFYRWQRG